MDAAEVLTESDNPTVAEKAQELVSSGIDASSITGGAFDADEISQFVDGLTGLESAC
jgi:hypothetical protein